MKGSIDDYVGSGGFGERFQALTYAFPARAAIVSSVLPPGRIALRGKPGLPCNPPMLETARRRWFSSIPMTPKWPSPGGHGSLFRLARGLGLVLLVKFALLTALWWAFFSHPVAPGMRAEPDLVREHVFPASNDAAVAPETVHAER